MTPCYTANYAAPEVLKRQGYDAACDIWSLGVMLYIILSGKMPFKCAQGDTSTEELLQQINDNKISYEDGNWRYISPEAKDLVKRMLNLDPSQRITAANILKHPWMKHIDALSDYKLQVEDHMEKAALAKAFKLLNPNNMGPLLNLSPVVTSSLLAKRRANKINSNA
jgi:p90 ribosomal S6 kinase